MENQNKKLDRRLNHMPVAGEHVQGALDIIEDLQKLSYSRAAGAAGEDGFTLSDSRCLLDKAALHLYDARSAIARQMALDDEED